MPLGQRPGDRSDSRYCGVETDFDDDMPHVLAFSLGAGFDFLVAPLIDPSYRPSLEKDDSNGVSIPPFAGSDLVLSPAQWSSHVVGKISSWIDLDSEDEALRMDSEIALRREIAWASHLSLQWKSNKKDDLDYDTIGILLPCNHLSFSGGTGGDSKVFGHILNASGERFGDLAGS